MFKTGLSSRIYDEFLNSYQGISAPKNSDNNFYVYAGEDGFKVITSLLEEADQLSEEMFATSIGGDGWLEILSI